MVVSFFCFEGFSQSKNTLKYDETFNSPRATIESVSWLSGCWRGKALGGVTEDNWSPALGNSMVGTFRLIVNGETSFYEVITITEENGTLIKRLKHFSNDLKGWEAKDKTIDFKLVKIEGNRVYFDGMTIERVNDSQMNIYVILSDAKGNNKEMIFPYKKIKL